MNNKEIAEIVEPFESGFSELFPRAWNAVLSTVPYLGIPTKIERANCMHRAIRNYMRPLCEELDPILQFVEEPDGQGKDYMIVDIGGPRTVALCWGRYGNGEIKRCGTLRNQFIQGQGYLFGMEDGVESAQATATIGYDVADDYTEEGRPCWWIQRLVLLRERRKESEFIKEVCTYEKAEKGEVAVQDYTLRLQEEEHNRIKRVANQIRKKFA